MFVIPPFLRSFTVQVGLIVFTSLFVPPSVQGAEWKPDPVLNLPTQRKQLYKIGRDYCDSHFDEKVGLIMRNVNKPVPHLVLQSALYARGLLMTKDPADQAKAESILRLVLTKQDLRKDSPTYGSFLAYYEDDWTTAEKPDPNFAQFVGLALADVLKQDNEQGKVLPADLRHDLEEALGRAVGFTIREDIAPDYINISILSAALGAAGAELLNYPGGNDFAMSKITWILTRAQPGNTFTEYLAPTYYGADLNAAYALKSYANTPELRATTDRLIDAFWKDIAASYHAPSLQLAGPNARSYGENMLEYAAGLKYWLMFALDGKYPLSDVETDHSWDCAGLMGMAVADAGPRAEFKEPVLPWRELQVMNRPGMVLRQFRDGDLVVGSINLQTVWQQQRNVVAYWPITTPSWAVGYFLDESSMTFGNGYARFFSTQVKGAVLVALRGKMPTPKTGGLQLVFNNLAEGKPLAGGPPGACEVEDGGVTVDIYPVTQNGGVMTFRKEEKKAYVERSWETADPVGNLGILSYLVVFRSSTEGAPMVKNLAFVPGEKSTALSAEVNGETLSLQVSN